MRIPFNIPLVNGREPDYIREAIANRHLAGNGPFAELAEPAEKPIVFCKFSGFCVE